MLTFDLGGPQTRSVTTVSETVRRLERELAELQARLDAMTATPPPQTHSPEARAWAGKHGIDLEEFVPFPSAPPGTFTMSVADAAGELQLSQEQVRRYLRSGRLRGVPLGGRAGWRVSRYDVARFRAERDGFPAALDTSASQPA